MANELYNNTYEKDITANILLKTGLDYSEIAMLLASQVSNCIKLVLRGQQIWIEQVTALANDLSNKECFEASISYTYCGRTLVYKAKLNITYAPNCVAPVLYTITFTGGTFTIPGQIPNSYLEYSTDGGGSWIRLPTPFAATTSITTSALPTNIDLKVRMVAVCDETKISNILDYDYIQSNCFRINIVVSQTDLSNSIDDTIRFLYEDCNGEYQTSIQNNAGNYTNAYCAKEILGVTYIGLDNLVKAAQFSYADLTTTTC